MIEMQGFTIMTFAGMPYTITANTGMPGGSTELYLFQKQ
jgi:hypothetical protein